MIELNDFLIGCGLCTLAGILVGLFIRESRLIRLKALLADSQREVVQLEQILSRLQHPVMPFRWEKENA